MRYTPAQQLARKIAKLKKQGIDENDAVFFELHHQLETIRNFFFFFSFTSATFYLGFTEEVYSNSKHLKYHSCNYLYYQYIF